MSDIYSFGDNQVTTENVKVTIFYKIPLIFYSLLETCREKKVTVTYWVNFFPVNAVIKIESDRGTGNMALKVS